MSELHTDISSFALRKQQKRYFASSSSSLTTSFPLQCLSIPCKFRVFLIEHQHSLIRNRLDSISPDRAISLRKTKTKMIRSERRKVRLRLRLCPVHWSNHHYSIRAMNVILIESTDCTSHRDRQTTTNIDQCFSSLLTFSSILTDTYVRFSLLHI